MGRIWVVSLSLLAALTALSSTPASGTPPPRTRPNYYNYRTDYDDDENYSQFEGDTAGNFHSEFGLRTKRPSARLPPPPPTTYADEEGPEPSYEPEDPEVRVQAPPLRVRAEGGGRGWVGSSHSYQPGDGSYSFGYDLQDQSSYSAGPSTGFVVQNRQTTRVRPPRIKAPPPPLLVPESPKFHPGQQQWEAEEGEYQRPWPPRRRKPSYVVKIRRPVKKEPGRFAPGWSSPSAPPKQRPIKANSWEDQSSGDGWSESGSSYPKDASYSFAYDAGSHNRQEYSDPWGTVRGSYSYVDPTGFRRTVHYTAGSATGFKVLNAQPSSVVSTVYREPSQTVHHQRQPSAFVYHLHPDGGWKPWEGRDDGPKGPGRPRPRPPNRNAVSSSYHYQSSGRKSDHEKPADQSRPSKADLEDVFDQQYSDAGESLVPEETRYEALTEPGERKVGGPRIRGYQGGYGDKNPLLVMSNGKPDGDEPKKPALSVAKLMSMRMSQSQRKGKSRQRTPKPEQGPMSMSNSGRLMNYPRSQTESSSSDQNERGGSRDSRTESN